MTTPPTGEEPPRGPGPDPWRPPNQGWGPPPQHPHQPAYGQPVPPVEQLDAPTEPPRDPKRRRRVLVLELVALAVAVGVATLVYVLSSTRLDPAAVERAVAAQFEERERVPLELECGNLMVVEPGADYECEGTTADGEEVEILITITDDDGAYTWAED